MELVSVSEMWGIFILSKYSFDSISHFSAWKRCLELYGPQGKTQCRILRPGKKYCQLFLSGGSESIDSTNCGWKIFQKIQSRKSQKAKLELAALANIYTAFTLDFQLFT